MTRKPSVSQLYKQFEKAEAAYRRFPRSRKSRLSGRSIGRSC